MTTDPIKKRVQELVPEVLELKFGCEVLFQRTPELFLKSKIVSAKDKRVSYLIEGKFGVEVHNLPAEKYIIGSPITLAVVLRALLNADLPMGIETWLLDEKPYGLKLFYRMGDGEIIGECWNLAHDNFDDQDEPTKQFIGTLLGVTAI